MEILRLGVRSAACMGALALAACSSGGGGNNPATTPATPAPPSVASPVTPVSVAPTVPAPAIGAMAPASLDGNSPTLATGNTPNFASGQPVVGTVFPLNQSAFRIKTTSAGDVALGAATLTFDRVRPGDGRGEYHLKVPGLSIDAGDMALTGNASEISIGVAGINFKNLNYTLFGDWVFHYANASTTTPDRYQSFAVSGYQTPATAMPSAGSANYYGMGNVNGGLMIPDQDGTVLFADLKGDASLTANFAAGSINGKLTGITASSWHGTVPWNTVTFNGSISGSTVSGSTTTSAPPPGFPPYNAALPEGSTGTINGAFYGPQAQEFGAVWTASGGGKSAVGVLAATQQ